MNTKRTTTPALVVLSENRSQSAQLRKIFADQPYHLKIFLSRTRLLHYLEQNPADVVLVTLNKQVDHAAAISKIRHRFPLIPILLLADGCTSQAIRESIRNGANHFVGGLENAASIITTIDRLVQFRLEHLRYVKVLPYLTSTLEFTLPSNLELLGGAVFYLTEELFRHGIISISQINAKIALVEALTNAMEHGNKFDPNKFVHVRAAYNSEQAVFDIRDEGEGFDFESIPDPTKKENLYRPRGRGVFMMRQFMDEVIFHPPGNHVTLIKKRSAEEATPRPYPWERRVV